ncbi:DNA-directed RNA polymerase II [Actinoplanes oblitus]|uniref:DNA-directed RNA polymerase II n=1 Tax=Actinoplanes oblitus TaxID=3040509 RepID=A0ABY8WKJ7_9ACTN|nr:DNA-directed RNA polymerase II [Actinoplanes oblitus]WIM97623.1 DNA-directed RNA polymerase II [Actinoplanes oblitus]
MPEQPQWSERTLDMPPQDPWAEPPTVTAPAGPPGDDPTRVQHAPAGDDRTRVQHAPAGDDRTRVQSGPAGSDRTRVQSGPAPATPPAAPPSPFSRGRAVVTPREQRRDEFTAVHEPTGTGWPGAGMPREQHSLGWHLRQLRRGGEWSTAAVLFAFVCWGIWALSDGGSLATPVVVFIITLLVGVGVFFLARLVGRVVLERYLHRPRHTARGAHMVAGLYLAGVGITFLRQTAWVMDAVNWIKDLF